MEIDEMVLAKDFCLHHKIDMSFIISLKESGLIDVTTIEERAFVPTDQLLQLEKMMRMQDEMDNNIEDVETVIFLLKRMHRLQEQILTLTSRLQYYEL